MIADDGSVLYLNKYQGNIQTFKPVASPPPRGGKTLLRLNFFDTDLTILFQKLRNIGRRDGAWKNCRSSCLVTDQRQANCPQTRLEKTGVCG